jgi:hypothetical protein
VIKSEACWKIDRRQRIVSEALTDEATEAVEAFAQIGRRGVGPHRDLARGADHSTARNSAARISALAPSVRTPCGVISTAVVGFSLHDW